MKMKKLTRCTSIAIYKNDDVMANLKEYTKNTIVVKKSIFIAILKITVKN